MMKPLLFLLATALLLFSLLVSCHGGKQGGEQQVVGAESTEATKAMEEKPSFPFPEIPAALTDAAARKAYLLEHYWDSFGFADTALVANREVTEQGLVNHLALLATEKADGELVVKSIDALCTGMEQHTYARKAFMRMMDDYLYDPNSPYYNESLYGSYLKRMLQSKALDEAGKSTLQFRLELVNRNRVGTKATSFAYYLPDGRQQRLNDTPVAGNALLLLFYDPECPTCHEVLQAMAADPWLAEAVERKQVSVLAIYTEGNEEVWRRTLPDMPAGWMVGDDRMTVKDQALYDLKAMPSLYLLDREKRVLLKDASYAAVKRQLTEQRD